MIIFWPTQDNTNDNTKNPNFIANDITDEPSTGQDDLNDVLAWSWFNVILSVFVVENIHIDPNDKTKNTGVIAIDIMGGSSVG